MIKTLFLPKTVWSYHRFPSCNIRSQSRKITEYHKCRKPWRKDLERKCVAKTFVLPKTSFVKLVLKIDGITCICLPSNNNLRHFNINVTNFKRSLTWTWRLMVGEGVCVCACARAYVCVCICVIKGLFKTMVNSFITVFPKIRDSYCNRGDFR